MISSVLRAVLAMISSTGIGSFKASKTIFSLAEREIFFSEEGISNPYSFKMSLASVTALAPALIRLLAPAEFFEKIGPGKNVAIVV